MKTYDILIIGAGSVGLPTAYHFAKKNVSVAVIEKEASVGRGQNKAAIGGIRATHSDPSKIAICQESIRQVSSMEKDLGYDVLWKQGGYLYPAYVENDEKVLKSLLEIQKRFHLNIDWIDPKAISALVPGINMRDLRGGTFSPEDGSASPLLLADAYYQLARKAGADFFFNEEVISVKTENRRITKVNTNSESYSAGLVINCAGAFGREVGLLTGHDFPVYPDSHEAGITQPVKHLFDPMIVDIRPADTSKNYYFYQNKEGQIVFCITPLPLRSGLDCDNTSEFLPQVVKRMIDIYPRLRNLHVRRTWRGLYPMTPDGFPLIGINQDIENNLLAIGMCGQGFMLGPGLGKILAETFVDGSKKHDFIFKQLSPYRSFDAEEALK
ncbi:MAG: FAD-binding oxidoreductase [Candidatus Marinimicrobia bacterium]|nr:FAD-binding oxidoreductase [Candidatus Neomarinimicrobiota bacterium]